MNLAKAPCACLLEGECAWIEHRRGNSAEAIRQMRAIITEEPGYYWGWNRLADWYVEINDVDHYLEASEAMVRLAPDDAVAAGYRGDARQKKGDREGAKADFRRAFEHLPSYTFASFQLFTLELADRNLDVAKAALDAYKAHSSAEEAIACEIQLAAATKDKAAAAEALAQLCTSPGRDSEWPLKPANRAFVQAGWTKLAERIYATALARDDVNPQVAIHWINRWVARAHWRRHPHLLGNLLARGDVGTKAVSAYLTHLAKTKTLQSVLSCVRLYRAALRADALRWGTVGFALLENKQYRGVVRWLSDWPDRAGAQPWMLSNLVYALRALERNAEANRVSRRALELERDYTSDYHAL